jgi:hypothetical protein
MAQEQPRTASYDQIRPRDYAEFVIPAFDSRISAITAAGLSYDGALVALGRMFPQLPTISQAELEHMHGPDMDAVRMPVMHTPVEAPVIDDTDIGFLDDERLRHAAADDIGAFNQSAAERSQQAAAGWKDSDMLDHRSIDMWTVPASSEADTAGHGAYLSRLVEFQPDVSAAQGGDRQTDLSTAEVSMMAGIRQNLDQVYADAAAAPRDPATEGAR